MLRLKAVLTPAVPAGPLLRRTAVAAAVIVAGGVSAGSLAIAAQREPLVVPASHQTPPAPRTVLRNPAWASPPQAMFPETALASGVTSARVTLRCMYQSDGSLQDCSVISETPGGQGFGTAALDAASRARIAPSAAASGDGTTPVTFNISFRLAG